MKQKKEKVETPSPDLAVSFSLNILAERRVTSITPRPLKSGNIITEGMVEVIRVITRLMTQREMADPAAHNNMFFLLTMVLFSVQFMQLKIKVALINP